MATSADKFRQAAIVYLHVGILYEAGDEGPYERIVFSLVDVGEL